MSEPNYLVAERGVRSWLLTRDHKRIGVMFLVMTTTAFLVGGLFALLLRIKLFWSGAAMMDPMTYNRLFTLHGVVMVWLFMIPAIPSAFGNFLIPLMIGARDVAFPRLNLLSVYLYAAGAAIALWGMIHGGADTGWTFYTPYSTTTPTQVVPVLLGVFVIGFSTILTGLNFIVTVHTLRAPGMTWMRMPLFVWSIYGTAVIQVLATPVLGLVLLLVAVEHAFGFGLFDPAMGGDPVLFQHLFWFYSHPAVYIMVLPAMAVMSEVVCAYAHKNPFNYKAIAYSSLGIAFVGFFTWGHHMFVSGQSTFDSGVFGVLSMLVGIFTAIKVFNWVGTMYQGSIDFRAPYVYVLGFLFFLVFGGMTGVAVATVSLDVHWTDTYFVVAHFHFIMVGVTIMAFLMGLHYWFPKLFGRLYPEKPAMVAAVVVTFGFIATFLPQFLLGNAGMPRRYYSYPAKYHVLHVASSLGATLLFFGLALVLVYLLVALFKGERAPHNPWGSKGFEWLSATPPPKHNYEVTPVFTGPPHDYSTALDPVERPKP
ncbi:MAG TPA: cbb3-type cytochrome c oxidase subunit I [Myxococcales bacterium]|jgi:cytochrome c oxidase subunit 1